MALSIDNKQIIKYKRKLKKPINQEHWQAQIKFETETIIEYTIDLQIKIKSNLIVMLIQIGIEIATSFILICSDSFGARV